MPGDVLGGGDAVGNVIAGNVIDPVTIGSERIVCEGIGVVSGRVVGGRGLEAGGGVGRQVFFWQSPLQVFEAAVVQSYKNKNKKAK